MELFSEPFWEALRHSPSAVVAVIFILLYFKNKKEVKNGATESELKAMRQEIKCLKTELKKIYTFVEDLVEWHSVKGSDGVTPRWYVPPKLQETIYEVIHGLESSNSNAAVMASNIVESKRLLEKLLDVLQKWRLELAKK